MSHIRLPQYPKLESSYSMTFNISSFSTALFSTWINVEELNLLIDAGDGLSMSLLQKARKIKYVFITHPDRDHLNGLPQYIQLNSRDEYPKINYPKDSGSFPAMKDFLSKFDPHLPVSQWTGIEDGQIVPVKKGYELQALRNEHIQAPPDVHKSLSYKLYEIKNKLKAEFSNLNPEQIKKIVIDKGRDYLTETLRNNLISFSGDTPVDNYEKWHNSEILIHEATFLNTASDSNLINKGNKHSRVDEVLKMVKEIKVNTLILNHFSSRYSKEVIDEAVLKLIKDLAIKIPVHLVYPGEIHRDILNSKPINE